MDEVGPRKPMNNVANSVVQNEGSKGHSVDSIARKLTEVVVAQPLRTRADAHLQQPLCPASAISRR